jgi:hypothetical protein
MSAYMDLKGTSELSFTIGLGAGGVKLKNNSSVLEVLSKDESSFLDISVGEILSSSSSLTLNSTAAESGADWKLSFARPAAGMTANVTYTFPAAPISGYFLSTDGSGNLSWTEVSTAIQQKVTCDSTSFSFSSFGSPLSLVTIPANAVVHEIQVIVDTAFDAGTIEVGIVATPNKYMATSQNDPEEATRFTSLPNQIPVGTSEAIRATFTGSPTAGTGRILVFHSVPA